MKPATTGERIVWGDAACASEWILDSFRKEIARADDRRKVAAIDAAIAEAVKAEKEACAEHAENYDLGTIDGHAIAKIIRARGNP